MAVPHLQGHAPMATLTADLASQLQGAPVQHVAQQLGIDSSPPPSAIGPPLPRLMEIVRAPCKERVCQYVFVQVLPVFFKQKTAYDMRISDWSSDVCSSDLGAGASTDPPGIDARAAPARVGWPSHTSKDTPRWPPSPTTSPRSSRAHRSSKSRNSWASIPPRPRPPSAPRCRC